MSSFFKQIALSLAACRTAVSRYSKARAAPASGQGQPSSAPKPQTQKATPPASQPQAEAPPLSAELLQIQESVKALHVQLNTIENSVQEQSKALATLSSTVQSVRMESEMQLSSTALEMTKANTRLDDQEETLEGLKKDVETSHSSLTVDPQLVAGASAQLESTRMQAKSMELLFAGNKTAIVSAVQRAELRVGNAGAALKPLSAMMQSVRYMLQLAEQTLERGGHPGDVTANVAPMMTQLTASLTQAENASGEASASLTAVEGLLKIDYDLEEAVSAVEREVALLSGDVIADEVTRETPSADPAQSEAEAGAADTDLTGGLVDEESDVVDAMMTSSQSNEDDSNPVGVQVVTVTEGSNDDDDDDEDDDEDDDDDIIDLTAVGGDPTQASAGQIVDPSLASALTELAHGGEYDRNADEEAQEQESGLRKKANVTHLACIVCMFCVVSDPALHRRTSIVRTLLPHTSLCRLLSR